MSRIFRILTAFIILMLIITAIGGFTYNEITAPNASSSTVTSTTVNISGMINLSGFPYLIRTACLNLSQICSNLTHHVINVTILNKSSSSGAYGILASSLSTTVNVTNTSGHTGLDFWDFQATLSDESYHWIKLNFTNVSRADDGSNIGSLTAARIINVDVDLYMIKIPTYNMSFKTADGTTSYCGVSDANTWGCSAG